MLNTGWIQDEVCLEKVIVSADTWRNKTKQTEKSSVSLIQARFCTEHLQKYSTSCFNLTSWFMNIWKNYIVVINLSAFNYIL